MAQAQTQPTQPGVVVSQPLPNASIDCNKTPNDPICKKVEVTQGFVNDATKAFDLVVTQRAAIEALLKQTNLSASERLVWEGVKAAYEDIIRLHELREATYEKLVEAQQKVIAMYSDLVDRLKAEVGKKKSLGDKILSTIKNIGYVLMGVGVGHVL